MKITHTKSHFPLYFYPTIRISALILFIIIFTQQIFGQKVLMDWGNKLLYVGSDDIAKLYLNDILGIWDDGKGTTINFYILNNPDFQLQGHTAIKKEILIIAAEIEYYMAPYMEDKERWWVSQNYKVKNIETKQNFKWDKIQDVDYYCSFVKYPYKFSLVDDKKTYSLDKNGNLYSNDQDFWFSTIEAKYWWYSCEKGEDINDFYLVFIPLRTGHQGFVFDFKKGFVCNFNYSEFPTPLKRISKGDVIPDEETHPIEVNKELKYAIEVTSSPSDVRPNGQSTIEINAILYSYNPGDDKSSKAVSGKNISFYINERNGIIPGSLSRSSAITDANGQVKVVYTAPEAELLQKTGEFINTATVQISCADPEVEGLAYIGFISEKGKVDVEPSMGIVSSQGIVPPDKRFPAVLKAYINDDALNPYEFTKTIFSITSPNPVGMLRGPDGKEGLTIVAYTDKNGYVEVEYYYAADTPPKQRVSEIIEVSSKGMLFPMKAEVVTGFNIVFENVENGYEGKNIINAGEEVPIRVKIKDAWNPELRLNEIINHWGLDGNSNKPYLQVRLKIKNISTVPDYLLDQLKLEKFSEPDFSENMIVKSFDKDEINHLRMSEFTFGNSGGYPRIRPTVPGTHYYEARVTLVDNQGKEVFQTNHPASKAYFNLQTGLPADATQIYFLTNPLNTETREAKTFATVLDLMGFGAILSVTDAMYKINNGDSEGLFNQLFSEVKGVIFDKVKERSAYHELAVDLYSGMALAEKVGLEIMKDKTGPLTSMENTIFKSLYNTFNWKPGQLVILYGDGNQQLAIDNQLPENNTEMSKMKEILNKSTSEFDKIIANALNKFNMPTSIPGEVIRSQEKTYIQDNEKGITSLKNGNISVYIIPSDLKVKAENAIEMKRY